MNTADRPSERERLAKPWHCGEASLAPPWRRIGDLDDGIQRRRKHLVVVVAVLVFIAGLPEYHRAPHTRGGSFAGDGLVTGFDGRLQPQLQRLAVHCPN